MYCVFMMWWFVHGQPLAVCDVLWLFMMMLYILNLYELDYILDVITQKVRLMCLWSCDCQVSFILRKCPEKKNKSYEICCIFKFYNIMHTCSTLKHISWLCEYFGGCLCQFCAVMENLEISVKFGDFQACQSDDFSIYYFVLLLRHFIGSLREL